jgi:DNA mismatch repair protein MutS
MEKASNKTSEVTLTPLMQQYMDIKNENPQAILLFRCGDFYETFFDDAALVARELQITLTARGKAGNNPVPMAGVPHHSVDGYIAKLVQKGHTVAICEQLEDPKEAKGLVKRDVVRIITPGTISDPTMLDENTNNYLSAYGVDNDRFCLASVDLSTGEMMITSGDAVEMERLPEELTRLMPREIICLTDNSGLAPQNPPYRHLKAEIHYRKISDKQAVEMLHSLYPKEHKASFLGLSSISLRTLGILADHLLDTQRCTLSHLNLPKEYRLGDGMTLDEATLGNLELLPTAGSRNIGGTLFDVLNRTRTSMGARMLKSWLLKPLIDVKAINERLDMVEGFVQDAMLLAEIRELLRGITDLERLLSRISLGSRNPRDLQALSLGLSRIPDLKRILGEGGLTSLASGFVEVVELTDYLSTMLLEELPANLVDGGYINHGVNAELDELRGLLRDGSLWLKNFEEAQREATGIRTLKVGRNNVFGYYIEISKGQSGQAPEHYVRKQTLTNGERYITAELKDYENKIFTASDKSTAIERELYEALVARVLEFGQQIKKNALAIARADVLASMAQLAQDNGFTRPVVQEGVELEIVGGRHPVVERFIDSGQFTPNDTSLDESQKQALITGPNMSGKSTYLRQVALIVLMAQAGSYVPAQTAKIGVVDRIFTRVGASDNLIRGQSTFMVEMMEAAGILRHATDRSLLILDEIGRGTSTFDGLSLAWAILEHINLNIKARTLFATHYHELTELETIHEGIFNLNVAVGTDTTTGNMVFMHKIEKGSASKSYGIEVAKLAGLPTPVVERAQEILFELEKTESEEIERVTRVSAKGKREPRPVQLTLFNPGNELIAAVSHINVNNITPLEALNILQRLKDMADAG